MVRKIGDLSGETRTLFQRVRDSFKAASDAFHSDRQNKGLEILAKDLINFVSAIESAFREVMGKLNVLEMKLDRQEAKLDKLESKLDKLEDKTDKVEVKLDKTGLVPVVPIDPGRIVKGKLTFESGETIPIRFTVTE